MTRILHRPRGEAATRRLLAFAAILGLMSLACSALTTTARAKLWLGPQTTLLGGVGICCAAMVALFAWLTVRTSGGSALDRPFLSRNRVFGVIAACAITSAIICWLGFDAFPNSADEYGFLFQARTFLHGRLWNPPPPDPVLFSQNYLVARNGIWISQYLPGWPAILSLFEAIGLPAWLAAPACGAGLLFLLWTALRMECSSPALVVATLLAYAATGFFLLNGATYFSHCASALLVVGGIVCMLRVERGDGRFWPAAAGGLVGLALLCRIDTALLIGTAVLAAWVEQGCRRQTLLLGLAGIAPPIAVFFAYNAAVTGNPLLLPTMWAGNLEIGMHGLSGVEQQPLHLRMLIQTVWRLGELADTASLLMPILYLLALLRIRTRKPRFYDIVPILNLILFLIFPDLGGFQMGPRYWFDGFAVMHITVASAFAQSSVLEQRFVTACALLLIPVSLARLPAQVWFEARLMHERSSVFRLAGSLPTGQRTIILVNDFYSIWNERFNRTAPNFAKDFVRNGTSFDRPVLYARGDVADAPGRACRLLPGAAIVRFHLDRAHPDGWLEPVPCGQARQNVSPLGRPALRVPAADRPGSAPCGPCIPPRNGQIAANSTERD